MKFRYVTTTLIAAAVATCALAAPVYAAVPGGEKAAIDAVLAQSPTDATLASASDSTLVDLAVRCVGIAGETYCLHKGWVDGSPIDAAASVRAQAKAQATTLATAVRPGGVTADGDATLIAELRGWAGKAAGDRIAAEAAELREAQNAVGKVVLFETIAAGKPLPADFGRQFPQWATIADRVRGAAHLGASSGAGAVAASVFPCDNGTNTGCAYAPMSTDRLKKQENYYNCGAASMQAFGWNNPTGAVYKEQATWESILGTTKANGTSIYSIKNAINTYTDWDSAAYAGTYVVSSISSWSVANYRSRFVNHIRDLHSPIQLHPVLNASTSTYYPDKTGGHFNVLMGYDYSVGDWNYLYEPAGGEPQGFVYTSVTAWEDTTHIRLAQLANVNQNIAY